MFASRHFHAARDRVRSADLAPAPTTRPGLAPLFALGLLIALLAVGGRGPAIASAQSITPESALLSARSSSVSFHEEGFATDDGARTIAVSSDPERALLGTSRSITMAEAAVSLSESAPAEIDGGRALLGQKAVTR
jgi:hypothetical protein